MLNSHILKQELDRWERSRRKLEITYGSACNIRNSGAFGWCLGCWCRCKGYRGQAHTACSRATKCSGSTGYCPAACNCFVPLCGKTFVLVEVTLQLGQARDGAAQLGSVISAHDARKIACSQVMALWKEFFLGLFITTYLPLFDTSKWMWQSSFGYTFDEILKWQP